MKSRPTAELDFHLQQHLSKYPVLAILQVYYKMLGSVRTAGKHQPMLEMPEDARNDTQLLETAGNC